VVTISHKEFEIKRENMGADCFVFCFLWM